MVLRILVVSPFPPARDGLAAYGAQVVSDLRAAGETVEVLSPDPSAARYWQRLKTFGGISRTARLGRRADKVIMQFHPEIFFNGMEPSRFVRGWLNLMTFFFLCRNAEVVVHETAYSERGRTGSVRMKMWSALWNKPVRVLVHTETERRLLESRFAVPQNRVGVLNHGSSFKKRTHVAREEARRSLAIEKTFYVFLCLGFLQPHKGFDRAADALAKLEGEHLRLHIVGEMRVWTPEHEEYVKLLSKQATSDPRIRLHEGYVSDELFDRWIVAADCLVLPYREIWSSGVVERANLYGRPVIVTDVGGLAEQVDSRSVVIHDQGELVSAMADLAGVTVVSASNEGRVGGGAEIAQRTITARAIELRRWFEPIEDFDLAEIARRNSDPGSGRLVLPVARPALDPKALVQRAVRRLVSWQLDPVVRYVNALRDRVMEDSVGSKPLSSPDKRAS